MRLVLSLLALLIAVPASAAPAKISPKAPDCTGVERYPATMAYQHLANARLLNPQRVALKDAKVSRVASEQIGPDLYRQVHKVTYRVGAGELVVLAVSDVSHEECSMGPVQVYAVSRVLGGAVR
jgi:hypothetical protein